MRQFLRDELGGWPLASEPTNLSHYSPLDLLKRMNKYGYLRFASISVSTNPNDPFHYIIKVTNLTLDKKVLKIDLNMFRITL